MNQQQQQQQQQQSINGASDYWCHVCAKKINPVAQDDGELSCPTCASSFVEQLENGALYNQSADELLDSAIDSVFTGEPTASSSSSTSTSSSASNHIPPPSPNLHPSLQNLFSTAANVSNQSADLSTVINNLLNGFMNPMQQQQQQPRTGSSANSPLVFNLNDIFNGFGMGGGGDMMNNGGGLRLGDYFLGDNIEALINQLIDHNGRVGTPPTSKRAMDSLPIISATEAHGEKECTICQEHYKVGEEIVEMPCKHVFHKECLWPWLLRHSTCPTCRHQLENTDSSPNPDSVRNDASTSSSATPPNASRATGNPPQPFSFSSFFNFGNPNQNNNNNNNNGSGSGGNMSYFL